MTMCLLPICVCDCGCVSSKRISPTAASRKEQEGSQRRIFDISSQSSARSAGEHASTLQHNAPSLRRRLYLFLDEPDSSRAASLWTTFIFALIVVSIVALMVENQVDANRGAAPDAARLMSFVVIIAVVNCIFTVELLLRLLVTDDLKAFCSSMYVAWCIRSGCSTLHGLSQHARSCASVSTSSTSWPSSRST